MKKNATGLGLAALLVSLGAPNAVYAQPAGETEAQSDGLNEIVVTARRREELLQQTPVSITALDAQALVERSVDDLRDVANFSPNVVITPAAEIGGAGAQVYIRGIGQFEQIMTTDPGVGVYIDGVYLGRTAGAMLEMVDFERIEVLRGPQGTLFGKNTIGGAINAVSRRPGDDFEADVGLTLGDYNRREVRVGLNAPLAEDRAALRFGFLSRQHDGYGSVYDFGTGARVDEAGAEDSMSARAALRVDFTPQVTTTITLDGTQVRDSQGAHHLEIVDETHPFVMIHNTQNPDDPFLAAHVLPGRFDTYADGDNDADLDIWGVAAITDWTIGESLDLKSVTSYRTMQVSTAVDGDGSPANYVQNYDSTDQRQWSQELQLLGENFGDRLQWVTGFLYFHEEADAHNLNFLLPDTVPFGYGSANNRSSINTDNLAVYGEGTYALTERFRFTAGVRYTQEEKEFSHDFRSAILGTPTLPPGTVSDEWNALTPRVVAEYRWTDDVMTYASVSRGFRSGGFNGRANTVTGLQSFDPEFVWAYEAGAKTEFFDNRVRVNASAYFNDYSDLQFLVIRADPLAGFALFTENAASAEVRGFEVEVTAAPINALELNLGIGHIDSEIVEVDDPTSGVPLGASLQEAPDWTVNAGAQYEWTLRGGGSIRVRVDASYQGETFHDGDNSPVIGEDGFTLYNARVGYSSPNDKWELALWGRNLGDESYRVAGINVLADAGMADVQYGAPREVGVSLNLRY
ncbi:MAG: TonB-dependent receptor [Hyphomonadaceae bacterium]|nr:TonB-dependent receptor [Hyphomonadaceae bacterium]